MDKVDLRYLKRILKTYKNLKGYYDKFLDKCVEYKPTMNVSVIAGKLDILNSIILDLELYIERRK